MKILITGAGLIGCYAAARLSDAGHDVVLFDLSPPAEYISNVIAKRDIVIRTGDIVNIRGIPELQPNYEDDNIDMIVHTAGVIGGNARANPYGAMRTNLQGTIELAEAARLSRVKRIVYASTHGVYDLDKIREAPFVENAPVTAESVYGATKLSSEHVLQAFGRAFGMQIVVLRFTNIFGYGEFIGGSSGGIAFQQLLEAALDSATASIPQPLNGPGEWLYVKDAASAIQQALEHPLIKNFTLLNIGSGVLSDENDIVLATKQFLPKAEFLSSKTQGAPQKSTERHQPFELSAAESEIGFHPQFSLHDGIADFIEELKRARNVPGHR
ncbi:MAG: NAD(P)-dependent oxidoreductase [Actinomycetota bacterium]|nr:MAG: NAD(P)-dependent oxidoreductase [Actinomycetota bacterium]